jgi:PAS domain S-box-containing protein
MKQANKKTISITAGAEKKKNIGPKSRSKKEKNLRVLLLEDNPVDAELMERELNKDGIAFAARRVDTRSGFIKALKAFQPELILADYKLPKFDALKALELRNKIVPLTPFIIITGSISEETAVECMKRGADDYLLKDRLTRLGEAVRHALEKRSLQKEKQAVEKQIEQAAKKWTTTFDSIQDGIVLLAADQTILQANRAFADFLNKPFKEIIGKKCYELMHSDQKPDRCCPFKKMLKSKKRETMELAIGERVFAVIVDPITDAAGLITGATHILSDITERKQSEEKLLITSKRLELALDSAKAGTWDWNVATGHIEWSPQMFELFGLDSRTASASFESWRNALHPEDREVSGSRIDLALKQHATLDSDYRIVFPDSRIRWINATGVGVYDAAGHPIQMIGICQDITERKRAEEQIHASLLEKDILLKEIHHRVKNNLQVISGLLALQADQIDDERLLRVIKQSQSRIWTMALIHQTLYQSGNLAAIDMADYIRGLAGNLLSSHARVGMPPTVSFDLLPVMLAVDKAIPLALVVNELVTNSLKHAFPDGRPGDIRITLRENTEKRTSPQNTIYDLIVADDGAGLPAGFDAATQKSLGLQLVAMLAKQLDGAMAIEASGGTAVRITFVADEKNKRPS